MRWHRQHTVVWACAWLVAMLNTSGVLAENQTGKDSSPTSSPGRGASGPEQFSAARVLMTEGKWQEAEKLLKQSDLRTSDPALSAAARNNLGYCLFQRAKSLAEAKPGEAMPLFQSAASAYRAALDVTPGDANAAQGLEVSRIWIKKLQDQQRQNEAAKKAEPKQGKPQSDEKDSEDQSKPADGSQPESQSKDQPSNPQNANQSGTNGSSKRDQEQSLQELAKDQQSAANETRIQSSKPTENADSPSTKEMQDRQQELTQRTQEARGKLSSSAPPPSSPKGEGAESEPQAKSPTQNEPTAQESLDKAARAQQKAEQALKDGDSKAAAEHQRDAARAIENAAEQLANDSANEKARDAGNDPGQASGKEGDGNANDKHASIQQIQQPKRELDPLAKQLLDREQRQRIQRQRWLKGQMTRPPVVDKDW